jgi:hypothetical protein
MGGGRHWCRTEVAATSRARGGGRTRRGWQRLEKEKGGWVREKGEGGGWGVRLMTDSGGEEERFGRRT